MEKKYITTSIAYINAAPHVGFAWELLQADALARWYRLNGHPTWFLTGTDEHGSKIAQVARDEGVEPRVIADRNSALFAKLKSVLNLSNDDFIRTSDQRRHWPGAQALWQKLTAAGDIYKDKYVGLYCVGCEAYVTEKDLVEGKCPLHKSKPEKIEEENYFFRLSKYADRIAEKIKTKELEIIPEGRSKEVLNVIESGLTDISFSRPKTKLPWGVPVPGDPEQTMYVWCDALSNYISAIGYGRDEAEFAKWWPADLHCIGKDILRFHAAIWPGMLLSAGLPLPKKILVHGFITSGGQKMSKSLGNVIDPVEVVDTYGADALRYYLLRELPTTGDGDFSWKRFIDLYNNELADNLGNLLNRAIVMAKKFSDGHVPSPRDQYGPSKFWQPFKKHMASLELDRAIQDIMAEVKAANIYIDTRKPWEQFPTNPDMAREIVYYILESLRQISLALHPFMPETSRKIREQLGLSPINEANFAIDADNLAVGAPLGQPGILFPKKS